MSVEGVYVLSAASSPRDSTAEGENNTKEREAEIRGGLKATTAAEKNKKQNAATADRENQQKQLNLDKVCRAAAGIYNATRLVEQHV